MTKEDLEIQDVVKSLIEQGFYPEFQDLDKRLIILTEKYGNMDKCLEDGNLGIALEASLIYARMFKIMHEMIIPKAKEILKKK